MVSLKKAIIDCQENVTDEDMFIAELDKIITDRGAEACQAIFDILTNIKLSPLEAQNTWYEVLAHRNQMQAALDRQIHLIPAMCDYLYMHTRHLNHPKLVEIRTFEKIISKSTRDSLTGLFNRRYFQDTLQQQFHLAKRYNNDLSVLFLDVDDFKEINDTYGHQTGDEVLKNISAIIEKQKRDSDIAIRFGGEEFVVLMPNTESINALIFAERMRKDVQDHPMQIDGQNLRVTISGGIAAFPLHAGNPDDLINYADSALYLAKGAGKNNIALFKKDNRRFLRFKLDSPVKVKELGFNHSPTFRGKSKDICIGGILFENSQQLVIGTKIQVSIPIGSKDPILLIGTVVRVEAIAPERYDIGMIISFKEMDKIVKNEISSFLIDHLRE